MLRRRLIEGGQSDMPGWEGHHIVAIGRDETAAAIVILERCNISVNDCENGVWLPGPESRVSNEDIRASRHPYASRHRNLDRAYDLEVKERIEKADERGGCPAVMEELREIRRELLRGDFPRHRSTVPSFFLPPDVI